MITAILSNRVILRLCFPAILVTAALSIGCICPKAQESSTVAIASDRRGGKATDNEPQPDRSTITIYELFLAGKEAPLNMKEIDRDPLIDYQAFIAGNGPRLNIYTNIWIARRQDGQPDPSVMNTEYRYVVDYANVRAIKIKTIGSNKGRPRNYRVLFKNGAVIELRDVLMSHTIGPPSGPDHATLRGYAFDYLEKVKGADGRTAHEGRSVVFTSQQVGRFGEPSNVISKEEIIAVFEIPELAGQK